MKVAVIGAGLIGRMHIEQLLALGHEVDFVCNSNLEKAKAIAKEYGIPNYSTDWNLALNETIEVIHICTPPALHFEIAAAALKANKHVVCEKPLCVTKTEAVDLYRLSIKSNKIAAVVFNVRYHEACVQAKEQITAKAFGEIQLVHGHYLQEFHLLPDAYSWRYQEGLAGKMRATTEIGSHWIDLMRYLTGLEVIAVSARFKQVDRNRKLQNGIMYPSSHSDGQSIEVESEDIAIIQMELENGALANLVLSEVAHGQTNQLAIQIGGTNQSVQWNNEQPYQLRIAAGKFEGIQTKTYAFGGGFSETFKKLFQAIYASIAASIEENEIPFPNFKDGAINAIICDTIYESAQNQGKWMEIKYEFDAS